MSNIIPPDSCASPIDNNLTVEHARTHILNSIQAIAEFESCALSELLDRVLAEDIYAPIALPPYNNSAMDGYAMHSNDIHSSPFSLKQIGTALAGKPYSGKIASGECIRIMTGAVLPTECNTVIMQEQAEVNGQQITFHGTHQAGQNVRLKGHEIQANTLILKAGHYFNPADIGLLASLGVAQVNVIRKLKVALISTGDELQPIGSQLSVGEIYDSNRYSLTAMLRRLGADVIDFGVIADDKAALTDAFQQAAKTADVIITSGGVSVGDADYVKQILVEIGSINFWKIAMKPGRPLAFGQIESALFFGLPGNPVSTMVTFYQIVQPALQKLAGMAQQLTPLLHVPTQDSIKKRAGRYEFQRGILSESASGELQVNTTGQQGSDSLSSMSMANCFILLDADCDGVKAGETVTVQPFSGLI